MSGSNGHLSGRAPGGQGGAKRTLECRQSLVYLQSLIRVGQLAVEDLPKTIEFARNVRDAKDATHRDRARAEALLKDVAKLAMEAVVHADKIERLDSGQATDRVEVFDVSIPDAR